MAKPLSAKEFMYGNSYVENVPCRGVRLPSGSACHRAGYWAFRQRAVWYRPALVCGESRSLDGIMLSGAKLRLVAIRAAGRVLIHSNDE